MKSVFSCFVVLIAIIFQSCTTRSCDLPAEVRTLYFFGYTFDSLDSSLIIKTDSNNNIDTIHILSNTIFASNGTDRYIVRLEPYLTAGSTYLIKTNNGKQFEIKDFEFNTVECKESTFDRKEDVLRLGAVKVNGNRIACEGKLKFYP
ncbi:hypothetical protein PN500_00010 [Dolichospermum circinale CS-541/06]|jgi:hypothetical protein|uniref:hypothetical protein n=1 Tax=Dolichospermum circinale TaxID=109265 RepID=UPI00232C3F3B|nr:hypothetical protein [Dolichospermum circinale]MDB9452693.1 hypothetical protein [Dolichospermum circinale CS-541/06]